MSYVRRESNRPSQTTEVDYYWIKPEILKYWTISLYHELAILVWDRGWGNILTLKIIVCPIKTIGRYDSLTTLATKYTHAQNVLTVTKRVERTQSIVIIKHKDMLMCNHKICINIMRCLRNSTVRREIGQYLSQIWTGEDYNSSCYQMPSSMWTVSEWTSSDHVVDMTQLVPSNRHCKDVTIKNRRSRVIGDMEMSTEMVLNLTSIICNTVLTSSGKNLVVYHHYRTV